MQWVQISVTVNVVKDGKQVSQKFDNYRTAVIKSTKLMFHDIWVPELQDGDIEFHIVCAMETRDAGVKKVCPSILRVGAGARPLNTNHDYP